MHGQMGLRALAVGFVGALVIGSVPASAVENGRARGDGIKEIAFSASGAGASTTRTTDPICEAIAEAEHESTACAAEVSVEASQPELASASQVAKDARLLSSDGTTLAKAAAVRTIRTRTWYQTKRGLYYVNWWEKHEGRIYYDNAGHVWSTTATFGLKGYHYCGRGGGIGYSIKVAHCTVEKRYDLSRPAISNWDRYQVHVIWKGIPIYASHTMHANAYDNGKITFP